MGLDGSILNLFDTTREQLPILDHFRPARCTGFRMHHTSSTRSLVVTSHWRLGSFAHHDVAVRALGALSTISALFVQRQFFEHGLSNILGRSCLLIPNERILVNLNLVL